MLNPIRLRTVAIRSYQTARARLQFFYERMVLLQLFRSLKSATSDPSASPLPVADADAIATRLRSKIRRFAGLAPDDETLEGLLVELRYLYTHADMLKPFFKRMRGKRVLFSGQAYYHAWYLSRAMRPLGWRADVLNWDLNPESQIYYHGEDIRFAPSAPYDLHRDLAFYLSALYRYDVFHFSNQYGMCFGFPLQMKIEQELGPKAEIHLLKRLGKSIAYTNNGCLDGVTQTAFSQWGPESPCAVCRWRSVPEVCSDALNLAWGVFRNEMADYQCLVGGNRIDYNLIPTAHECPAFYCLDPELWNPALPIPDAWKLPADSQGVRLYHVIGNRKDRTDAAGVNIKSSHIYLPLIEKLRAEGHTLTLLEPEGVPNREVRFIQMQADIVLDMLTFGWFGANAREAMMLGKPVICFIRPEWLESVRLELPDYAAELPIISATPDTVEAVLRDLIAHPEKRKAIGEASRAFAMKWHAADVAALHFNEVYSALLRDNPPLVEAYA